MPQENIFRTKLRKPIDDFIVKIPFPRINPDYISFFTLITTIISVYFFLNGKLWVFWIFLLLTLLLDWLDGTIARKYKMESIKGWWLDKIIDRISEIIIFSFVWLPGLLFIPIGLLIMYLSYKNKFPLLLMFMPPLRFILLAVYFFKII
ncbi:MAG: CDP-alcohol phosphatidyltransferase family protein [Nanoarchaeota archaeon]